MNFPTDFSKISYKNSENLFSGIKQTSRDGDKLTQISKKIYTTSSNNSSQSSLALFDLEATYDTLGNENLDPTLHKIVVVETIITKSLKDSSTSEELRFEASEDIAQQLEQAPIIFHEGSGSNRRTREIASPESGQRRNITILDRSQSEIIYAIANRILQNRWDNEHKNSQNTDNKEDKLNNLKSKTFTPLTQADQQAEMIKYLQKQVMQQFTQDLKNRQLRQHKIREEDKEIEATHNQQHRKQKDEIKTRQKKQQIEITESKKEQRATDVQKKQIVNLRRKKLV